MGKRNPDLLARGVSPSCRCGQPNEYHTRDVCGPCYRYHTQRLHAGNYAKKLARWRANYYERRQHHVSRAYAWNVKNKDRHYLNTAHYKYGLKPSEYRELFEAQGGRCAICHVRQEDFHRRFHIDHDHVTGTVRGLLCAGCNFSLGPHEKAGTSTYRWYLEWTPMMRLQKMKTLTDEERALWNW
jgi:hypothetical protein